MIMAALTQTSRFGWALSCLCLSLTPALAQTQQGTQSPPSAQGQPPQSQFVPNQPQKQVTTQQRPRMTVLGIFDAGQPGVGIFKMYDPSDQVLCYALMPEAAGRKVVGNSWVYDGNSVGSISCVKVDIPQRKDDNNAQNSTDVSKKNQKK
jgi:hypothetical protein